MKETHYKSYDDLPLFLNAKTVAKVPGVSPSSGYELLHDPGFPVMRVGNRQGCWACHRPVVTNGCTNWASQCCVGGHMVVPKEQFIRWVSDHTGGGT